ncbi:Stk1 family PASTA domain-containing Ser/Thr kinase [Bifidobacterium pseudolongum]|uniref:Stk1 family PASTA domain-containing Ser/Thr kinase n=1 Tax=Bifidobacterium pseudolongum TaxID=1694 RepID=UPI000C70D008|nr:Stk1 family PASTA domain-containing Ser/Thr kinase [Bifidobacterium pseudolongum]
MSEAANMPENKLIDGRYRIVRKIADGGMATVYQAVDVRLGRDVALKIMHIQLAQGPHRDQFVERFRREANSAAAIANPHVVQVYDTGENDGLDYLVMEYVHGVNLRHEMQTKRTFSVRETLRVVSETLNGLAAAHRAGVVHRDIKPENILINDRGRVQITDFGLAKAASQATLSSTGMLLGTAAYLAPEMIENNLATPQGDCYSVGIMAWEMLTGQVPFLADNPVTMVFKHVNENVPSVATVCTGIDPQVARFISYLTNRDVNDRPADASQALDRLNALMRTLPPQALQYRFDPDAPAPNATTVLPVGGKAQTGPTAAKLDDRTQAVPMAGAATAASTPYTPRPSAPPTAANADATPTQVHHGMSTGKRWAIGVAIAAAVLALGGAAGWGWWYYAGPGSYYEMPQIEALHCQKNAPCKIAGVPWADYEKALKAAGIAYETSKSYSDTVPEGDIISTDPEFVNAHVSKRGDLQKVRVIVSQGVQQSTVPDDIMSSTDPLASLKRAGFTNIVHSADTDEWSLDVPEGEVISITPEAGTTVDHNEPVDVVLSKGPMPVSMPEVVGKPASDVKAALEEDKLTVTTNEEFSDTVPAGQVMSSSEDAGAQLHWGDSVHLVVSKGPEMGTVPDVIDKSPSEATKILEEAGFRVKVEKKLGIEVLHRVIEQNPAKDSSVRLRDTNGDPTVITIKIV